MKETNSIKLKQALQKFPDINSFIEHLKYFKKSLSNVKSFCEEALEENRNIVIQLLDVSIKYKEMELKLNQLKANERKK